MSDDLISLPNPQPLLPLLLEAGFSHKIAIAASQIYQQRAEEFRQRTESMLVAAWRRMATPLAHASALPLDPLTRKHFTQVYLRCLEEWKEEMVQLLKQALPTPSKATSERKSRSFNHEYLPLLERFFDENPFPTHADKVSLAKKSNMEYRQIHVWFQNRRNRKKGGKALRRKQISEGVTRPLDRLCECTKGCTVKQPHNPFPASLSVSDVEIRVASSVAQECVFTSSPPPHTFPSSYPPTCTYDPFPCKSGLISFGKPEWKRAPCSKPLPSVSLSIDDLVHRFSRLNVRSDTLIKDIPASRSAAATAAITVIPSRAPHPSLVNHENFESAQFNVHYPSVRAPAQCARDSQVPRSTSNPITLKPTSHPSCRSDPLAKGGNVSFPPRFPGRTQTNKWDSTPSDYSSASLSSWAFARFGSRGYSFSRFSSTPFNVTSIRELSQSPSC